MPVINNAYPVDESNYAYSPSDMDLSHRNMSQKDINALIDSMCKTRMENPDVVLMDQIKDRSKFYDPLVQERVELEQDNIAVEEEILKGIFESDTPMSMEERNELIAKGLYQKYQDIQAKKQGKTTAQIAKEDNQAMNDIEAELRANMSTPIVGGIEGEEITQSNFPVEFTEEKESTGTGEIANPVEGTALVEEGFRMDAEGVIKSFQLEREHEEKHLTKEQVGKALSFPGMVAGMANYQQDDSTLEEVIDELNETVDDINNLPSKIVSTDEEDKSMSIEEFNDVPATEISLPDDVLTNALMSQYDNVNYQDAMQLISVMNRYKAHEKFNVFESLPMSIKSVILQEAASVGAGKDTINFFAKTFINDLVNNTYLDKEIKDFNSELQEAMAPMGNIVGTMMDEYNDEVYDKFTTKLIEKAEEIKDTDYEKSRQLYIIASNFEQSLSMIRIQTKIENDPPLCNKHYKNGRDSWNKLVDHYNEVISTVSPKPRDLDICLKGLITIGYPEDYSKAFISLMVDEVEEAVKNGSLEEHIYAYYLTNSIMNLNYTANNSKAIENVKTGVDKVVGIIGNYMAPLKERNTKRDRRRNKRKNK